MITFKCDSCGVNLSVFDDKAGKKGKCPNCGGLIRVPLAGVAQESGIKRPRRAAFPQRQGEHTSSSDHSCEVDASPVSPNSRDSMDGLDLLLKKASLEEKSIPSVKPTEKNPPVARLAKKSSGLLQKIGAPSWVDRFLREYPLLAMVLSPIIVPLGFFAIIVFVIISLPVGAVMFILHGGSNELIESIKYPCSHCGAILQSDSVPLSKFSQLLSQERTCPKCQQVTSVTFQYERMEQQRIADKANAVLAKTPGKQDPFVVGTLCGATDMISAIDKAEAGIGSRDSIRYLCTGCGQILESEAELAGGNDICPVCGHQNTVPEG